MLTKVNESGQTAYMIALKNNHPDIAKLIFAKLSSGITQKNPLQQFVTNTEEKPLTPPTKKPKVTDSEAQPETTDRVDEQDNQMILTQ